MTTTQPIGQPKPAPTSAHVQRLVAEKDDSDNTPAAVADTTDSWRPPSGAFSTTQRTEDRPPRQTDSPDVRRASSGQGRARPDLAVSDTAAQKPPARRASQTEAKRGGAGRQSPRTPDARAPARRGSAEQKLTAAAEPTTPAGRETGGQRQPRVRRPAAAAAATAAAAARGSREKPEAAAGSTPSHDETEKYSKLQKQAAAAKDDGRRAAFGGNSTQEDRRPTPPPAAQNNVDEDRDNEHHPRHVRTTDLDLDSTDEEEVWSKGRVAAGDSYPDKGRESPKSAKKLEMPSRRERGRNFENAERETSSEDESSGSVARRDGGVLTRRRESPRYASTWPQRAQQAGHPAPQRGDAAADTLQPPGPDAEPRADSTGSSRRARDRDAGETSPRRKPRSPRPERKDSVESLSRRLAELDARRRAEYPPSPPPPRRAPSAPPPDPSPQPAAESGRQHVDLGGCHQTRPRRCMAGEDRSKPEELGPGDGGPTGFVPKPTPVARPRAVSQSPRPPPRPILRRTLQPPPPGVGEPTTAGADRVEKESATGPAYQRRAASLSPAARAVPPPVVPPRRSAAVASVVLNDDDDDDEEELVVPRYAGRHRLSKRPALTDLSDHVAAGVPRAAPSRRPRAPSPAKSASPSPPPLTASTALTPRRIWECMRVRQLMRTVLDVTRQLLSELFCLPEVGQ